MKYKVRNCTASIITAVLVFASITSSQTPAQEIVASTAKSVPPPSAEKFVPTTDLISPWRSSACANLTRPGGSSCVGIIGPKYLNASNLIIHNEDGTIWFDFDLNKPSPKYWWKNSKVDFMPFASTPREYPLELVLRAVGESPNWYEVEVNESTRATRYILRSDPLWSRTTWVGWLYRGTLLHLSENHPALVDKPNGLPIEEFEGQKFKRVLFLKAEGDWAYVQVSFDSYLDLRDIKGWIRWRNGRDILVGCYFNNFKAP